MKILVVSLLRLGDLFMQKPLLQELRRRRPGARLHVLVNASVAPARDLFPEVDEFHYFQRETYQRDVATAEVPLLRPLRDLDLWIDDLSSRGFDEILNFTHTQLSAHLCAAIDAPEKKGLLAEGLGFRRFENAWLRHFNERFSSKGRSTFHYVEFLARSFGLSVEPGRCSSGPFGKIYLQLFTSDAKKDWDLASWRDLFDLLSAEFPNAEVRGLVAPFEAERASRLFAPQELAVLGLAEASRELGPGALLVSGDTSLVHLAASRGAGLVALSLGSSSPDRTGPFAAGAWVVESTVSCAPCPALGACRQTSHQCEEKMTPLTVFSLIRAYAAGPAAGCEAGDPEGLRLWSTRQGANGTWELSTLNGSGETLGRRAEKALWELHLEQESHPGLPALGGSARALWESVDEEDRLPRWQEVVRLMRDQQERLEGHLREADKGLERLSKACLDTSVSEAVLSEERRRLQSLFCANAEEEAHLRGLRDLAHAPAGSPFAYFGQYRLRLEEMRRRLDLRRRLIHQLSEMGGFHEQAFGQLSESRPEAT